MQMSTDSGRQKERLLRSLWMFTRRDNWISILLFLSPRIVASSQRAMTRLQINEREVFSQPKNYRKSSFPDDSFAFQNNSIKFHFNHNPRNWIKSSSKTRPRRALEDCNIKKQSGPFFRYSPSGNFVKYSHTSNYETNWGKFDFLVALRS